MRAETGPMQFDGDWPGLFIRGDNTFRYVQALRELEAACEAGRQPHRLTLVALSGLLKRLESCDVTNGDVAAQEMIPFADALKAAHGRKVGHDGQR